VLCCGNITVIDSKRCDVGKGGLLGDGGLLSDKTCYFLFYFPFMEGARGLGNYIAS
jgi:hypothetical protein